VDSRLRGNDGIHGLRLRHCPAAQSLRATGPATGPATGRHSREGGNPLLLSESQKKRAALVVARFDAAAVTCLPQAGFTFPSGSVKPDCGRQVAGTAPGPASSRAAKKRFTTERTARQSRSQARIVAAILHRHAAVPRLRHRRPCDGDVKSPLQPGHKICARRKVRFLSRLSTSGHRTPAIGE
jgi:hypothetical protein